MSRTFRTPRSFVRAAGLAALLALGSAPGGNAGEDARPAGAGAAPQDGADARRLNDLRLRLLDWSASDSASSRMGLELRAAFIPDAIVYKTARMYVGLRKKGNDHSQAIAQLARSLPRWKRYENKALFLVTMVNESFKLNGKDRRVFTQQKRLERHGISIEILPADRGPKTKGRRLRFLVAGKPSSLRLARLRIKKFWKTADGATRLSRSPADPLALDPASIGRQPVISDPFPSLVIEEKPVELELLVDRKAVNRAWTHRFRVGFHHWKRYEGPFENDLLDLNQNRPWNFLEGLRLDVRYPPGGMNVGPELQDLVREVSLKARELED